MMARRSYLLWGMVLIGWVAIGMTWTLNYYIYADHYVAIFSVPPSFKEMVIWELPYWILWAALTPVVFRLTRRYPLGRGKLASNLSIHILACIALSVCHRALYLMLGWVLHVTVYEKLASVVTVYHFLFLFNLPTGFMSYGSIMLICNLLIYYQHSQERELRSSQLETRLAQAELHATAAELRALKMQLQPHFLFNTLNSISALLEDNVQAADEMLSRLADLLRLTLDNSAAQTVPLAEELEFLKCYLEIERARFQDLLVVEISIDPDAMDALVPNLVLQPIVENAIKHAVAPRRGAGHVELRAVREGSRLVVTVIDDGDGRRALQEADPGVTKGLGLSNTRARLAQLYPDQHTFLMKLADSGGLEVRIEVPLTTAQPVPLKEVAAL
jgi:two-component system, LytTR family, sensor kinase